MYPVNFYKLTSFHHTTERVTTCAPRSTIITVVLLARAGITRYQFYFVTNTHRSPFQNLRLARSVHTKSTIYTEFPFWGKEK